MTAKLRDLYGLKFRLFWVSGGTMAVYASMARG